jgi:hypothetical protein
VILDVFESPVKKKGDKGGKNLGGESWPKILPLI